MYNYIIIIIIIIVVVIRRPATRVHVHIYHEHRTPKIYYNILLCYILCVGQPAAIRRVRLNFVFFFFNTDILFFAIFSRRCHLYHDETYWKFTMIYCFCTFINLLICVIYLIS
jgi:hypothetical protein